MEILIFRTLDGKEPFNIWLTSIRDSVAKLRILKRIQRLAAGHFGDYKSLGEGVHELRFFFGSGYRVYFGKEEDHIVILLCGGDKSGQSRDIKKAKEYWDEYREYKNATIH